MFLLNYLLMKQVKMHMDYSPRKMTTTIKIGYAIILLVTDVISPTIEVPKHFFNIYKHFDAYYVPLFKEVKAILIREMDHLVSCLQLT